MSRTIFILSAYFVFAYPVNRCLDWTTGNTVLAIAVSTVLWIVGMAGMRYSFSGPNMKVRYLVVHWLGGGFIFAALTALAEVVRLLAPYPDRVIAHATLLSSSIAIIIAMLLSHHISIRRIEISSNKVTRAWRVVQLSDVHVGSRQTGYFARVIDRVRKLKPDIMVITGDLLDSSAVEIEALYPLTLLEVPVYFVIGNHERYAGLEKVMDMSRQLGIRTLRQQSHEFGDFCITGIDDSEDPHQVSQQLPKIDINQKKFNILLYHRPVGWEAALKHDIDLMLSGHTHKGQIFPFNFVVGKYFKRIHGLYRKHNRFLYVSPGTGTWGPLMRLGSFNEISMFSILPVR